MLLQPLPQMCSSMSCLYSRFIFTPGRLCTRVLFLKNCRRAGRDGQAGAQAGRQAGEGGEGESFELGAKGCVDDFMMTSGTSHQGMGLPPGKMGRLRRHGGTSAPGRWGCR